MDLLARLESEYLPLLRTLEANLRAKFPLFRFYTGTSATGSLTTFKGHDIVLECIFPDRTNCQVDNVALVIALCHLDRLPRLMADVCWGAPSAFVEDSLIENWTSSEHWPVADEGTLQSLRETFPRLSRVFEQAVARGTPRDED